jgi:acetyl esterase/lipase/predicted small secreted protein
VKKVFVKLSVILIAFVLSGCATSLGIYKDTDAVSEKTLGGTHKSFGYWFVETVTVFSGHKQSWERDADDLAKYVLKTDQSKRKAPPAKIKRKFAITETTIQGRTSYIIAPKENPRKDKIVMFFHGGGLVFEMFSFDWDAVGKIAGDLSIPVFVLTYPIYPETNPDTILSFVIESYEYALAVFPGAQINMIGASAGADLMLSLCHYLTQTKSALPFPDKLICISPAMVVGIDDQTLAAMNEIAPHDLVLPMKMVETLPVLFNLSQDKLDIFNDPFYGDFSQFPPIYIFSGTLDIFYPQMAPFMKRVRDQGKQITFYSGYKLMHGWPLMPMSPECKEAMSIILDIIEDGGNHRR